MNAVFDVILQRKSVRAYKPEEISQETKEAILGAAMRAPTAGNMMLYSIIEVTDQAAKDTLAETCDHQPFIAKAPWVLLFLADYQRWYDYFLLSGAEDLCQHRGEPLRKPEEGDLMLACCDALIAAQTAVVAAESLGIGSCYIGDIMENYETHRDLFDLPPYTFPIALLCLGYPTEQQLQRTQTTRFDRRFVVFEDRYKRLDEREFEEMFHDIQERFHRKEEHPDGIHNTGQLIYARKFSADFAKEMSRSVRAMLNAWTQG